MFTAVSLDFHTLPPATLDFDAVYRRDFERFNMPRSCRAITSGRASRT